MHDDFLADLGISCGLRWLTALLRAPAPAWISAVRAALDKPDDNLNRLDLVRFAARVYTDDPAFGDRLVVLMDEFPVRAPTRSTSS